MSTKLWEYAGFTIRTGDHKSAGLFKLRVSNSSERAKVLARTDNEMITMFELPYPMTKDQAATWLGSQSISGITPVSKINS